MPVVACPGCGKQYNLPVTAAGQIAKCACGKRFRLGESSAPPSASSKSPSAYPASKPVPTGASASAATSKLAVSVADDDFLNEALKFEVEAKPNAKPRAGTQPPQATTISSMPPARPPQKVLSEQKKPPKKKKRIRWGFDWGKVATGLLTFFIAGGITLALLVTTGYLYFWPAGIAVVGLLTALSGLMGEEGIW